MLKQLVMGSKMTNKKIYLPIMLISCFILLIVFNSNTYDSEIEQQKKIILELNFDTSEIKPGDQPILLTQNLLARLLPELKNPRLMSLQDLDSTIQEPELFIERGYAFVLTGDFNNDGNADVSLVGRYDNSVDPQKTTFITIVTIKGKKLIREYFQRTGTAKKIFLVKELNYKPKIDAIKLIFTLVSDECGTIYWTSKEYKFEPCQSFW